LITPDIILALRPVVEAFDNLNVGYYIGGSLASSAHGLPRATLDVDLVADLKNSHVQPLVKHLEDAYYIDSEMIYEAVRKKSSFNIINLETMLKLDIFVLKNQPYDQIAFQRAQKRALDPNQGSSQFSFAAPEDIVLHKLFWFRMGGEISERQWSDVGGVLKVQAEVLDFSYMKQWAEKLKILDLLTKSLRDSGLSPSGK